MGCAHEWEESSESTALEEVAEEHIVCSHPNELNLLHHPAVCICMHFAFGDLSYLADISIVFLKCNYFYVYYYFFLHCKR